MKQRIYYFGRSTPHSRAAFCTAVRDLSDSDQLIVKDDSLSSTLHFIADVSAGQVLGDRPWPHPQVTFHVQRWNEYAEEVEWATNAYLEANIWRWARSVCKRNADSRVDDWEKRHGLWEEFNLIRSFQIQLEPTA